MRNMSVLPSVLYLLLLATASQALAAEVVVYSARKEHLIKPLFDAFTNKTGIKVRYVTDKAGPLLARLIAEGNKSPADVLMTVDAGNLWHAAKIGVLSRTRSAVLTGNIPAHLRDPGYQWFGLSVRARTIVYNTKRVKPQMLSTYQDLSEPKWKGRVCLRTSKKVYNQSLVAMMIARLGEEPVERIVRGWVANLAAPVFANDTRALKSVAAGLCDVTIVNTYYYGRLMKKEPGLPLAIFWPNQNTSGVHINISGAGITRYAPHRKEALVLLEWLSSPDAQGIYAGLNFEYPVNPQVRADPVTAAWGAFMPDQASLADAGRLQSRAVMLMDRAGYR